MSKYNTQKESTALDDNIDDDELLDNLLEKLKRDAPELRKSLLESEDFRETLITYELAELDVSSPGKIVKVLTSDFGREVLPNNLSEALLVKFAEAYNKQSNSSTDCQLQDLSNRYQTLKKKVAKYKIIIAFVVGLLIARFIF